MAQKIVQLMSKLESEIQAVVDFAKSNNTTPSHCISYREDNIKQLITDIKLELLNLL